MEVSSSLPADSRLNVYDVTQLLLDRAMNTRRRARGRSSSEQSRRPHNVPVYSRSFSLTDQDNGDVDSAAASDDNLEVVVEHPTEIEHDDDKQWESKL